MKREGDELILLSTGRRVQANKGLLSIDEDGNLCEGYDGHFTDPDGGPLTTEERWELAEYMIDLWRRWTAGELGGW